MVRSIVAVEDITTNSTGGSNMGEYSIDGVMPT